jgi:hypothetical protein
MWSVVVDGGFTGLDVPTPAPEEVARYTVRTMLRSVPGAVPGTMLLHLVTSLLLFMSRLRLLLITSRQH